MSGKKKRKALRFFNEAVEYIDKFDTKDIEIEENTISLKIRDYNSNFLRDEMLTELNNLRNLIRNNPDLKIEKLSKKEKEVFYAFIQWAKYCPICGNQNHFFSLKQVYFDDNKKLLIKELIRLMMLNNVKLKKFNLQLGIPCCNCYNNFFKE
jgi:hypothetical protein